MVAAFDVDPQEIGGQVEGVPVQHVDQLARVVVERNIQIAMIAVPAKAAQPVADRLIEAGIAGIVNFAPVTLALPDTVSLVGVDLAIELEQISFSVANRPDSP